ncbi:MAG: hypothetical protein ACPL4H_08295 [Anaerolineales bacterium]
MDKYLYEIRFLQTVLPQLENYLLSSELYRLVFIPTKRDEPAYPSLSLGTLLLSLKKAHGYGYHHAAQTVLAEIEEDIATLRQHWRQAWENKTMREMQNRGNLWQTYLSELLANPRENNDRYAYEVRHRVMLELLQQEIKQANEINTVNLALYDQILRPSFHLDHFIWDDELQAEFPNPPYWFLWGKPLL